MCAAALLLTLFLVNAAHAQPLGVDALQWYQHSTQTVLNNARRLIEPTLSPSEQQIARSIVYRVTSSPGIGAFAGYEDSRRIVVIHSGTIQMMDWFVDALWMNNELHHNGCFEEFVSYLQGSISENQDRVARGLTPRPVMPPVVYADRSSGACHGITPQQMLQTPEYGERRAAAIGAGIMSIYLHELGHHVKRHTDGKRTNDPTGLAMSRNQEDEADRFAISAALRARYSLIPALPWYLFMSAFGGNSIEAETKSDHPLGIRRMLVLLEQTLDFYQRQPTAWPDQATYRESMQDLQMQIGRIRTLIRNLS